MIEENKDTKIILTSDELNEVRLNTEIIKNMDKDEEISQLKLDVLNAQEMSLKAQSEVIKRDRIIIEYRSLINKRNKERAKEESKQSLLNISSRYDALNGKKWGFNPDTGEIIINNDE